MHHAPADPPDAQDGEHPDGRSYARVLEAVGEVGRALASELDLRRLVQAITDASTRLTGGEFGAFFYNVLGEWGEAYSLYTRPGGPREALAKFPIPRDAELFGPTFRGEGVVRSDDVSVDARFGSSGVYRGMPPGNVAVRSYLAAPVVSRSGEVLGGLFFGHGEAGRFGVEHERVLAGIAQYAGIALDNARLYDTARSAELANGRLAAIVQSSDDAIVSKNLDGIVQSWNAGAERMFGYTSEEMVGRPIAVLIPEDRPEEETGILARLRRGERVDHFETVRRTKDGREINVSVTISPVRNSRGEVVGASKVARDITDRKRAEREREVLLAAERAARESAERHSRMKDEFLATLGHELRTPLNAVLGWATLLRGRAHGPAELEHALTVIERNARQQAQLIEDLLDMSRIVSGKLRLHVQGVELGVVIQAALDAARPAAEAKGVSLGHDLASDAGQVSGDANRLQQVVWNLVSNAVKFTPRGGAVRVGLERVASQVRVSVTDTGEGISAEFLPLVFDRFRQADSSTTRRHGGLGLGLAIVKHLVELHGGTVAASSEGVGRGASFSVSFPVRATSGAAAVADLAPSASDVSLAGVRVVVVDDEADARELVARVLEEAGARVGTAGSAEEALGMVQRERPDVVVSDIGMPGEDGYQLVQRIRMLKKEEGGLTPAVALTAFARVEDRRRALLSGFQMHMAKPVEPAELVAVVASVTGRV
jgi:PAS domain S-box-containing protein